MTKSKKLVLITWLLTLVFILCAFLPILKFSFNDYSVNIFGICEEFDSRDRAAFEYFAPLGYAVFAVIALAALTQVLYLTAATKDASKAKGKRKFSVVMTGIAVVAFAGYLLLVAGRSDYTLTAVPFLFVAAGLAFIVLSGQSFKMKDMTQDETR